MTLQKACHLQPRLRSGIIRSAVSCGGRAASLVALRRKYPRAVVPGATEKSTGLSTPSVPPIQDVKKDSRCMTSTVATTQKIVCYDCVRLLKGISGIITLWLNEEWTQLDVHTDVGAAAARAYVDARQKGMADMGDLVLELSSLLTTFDFSDTFTGPFDVANKVVEFLMLRDGIDVCCTSDDDISLLRRYNDNFHS